LEVKGRVLKPAASVVIPAYRARAQIDGALDSLAAQTFHGEFETIVVVSGNDGCAEYLEEDHPTVRVLNSRERLWPGRARNLGVRAAQGEVIAFMPADARATRNWLEARIAVHDRGADLVGGSILNGDPRHPVACAEYLLEYSALLPVMGLLEAQTIPHAVSFRRSVFDRVGFYPEDTTTGEDTLFNRRCVEAGLQVAYAPEAGLFHSGNRSLGALCRHAHAHGRGLVQCMAHHGLASAIGPLDQSLGRAGWNSLVGYPSAGMRAKVARLARYSPRTLVPFLVVSPLVAVGLLATGIGAFSQYHELGLWRS
jgi:GT2 family glycosyltransferase